MKHGACDQYATKAGGEAKHFTSIEAAPSTLFYIYVARVRQCFNCFKGYTINTSIRLAHFNLCMWCH